MYYHMTRYHNTAADGHDAGFGTGAKSYGSATDGGGGEKQQGLVNGDHFLMQYGFVPNERIQAGLPTPGQVGM